MLVFSLSRKKQKVLVACLKKKPIPQQPVNPKRLPNNSQITNPRAKLLKNKQNIGMQPMMMI